MGWVPSLGGVFIVVTEPVECAEDDGNIGLRVGGLLVAMVGLKVTLRTGRSGFLPSRGVDSACVAMMRLIRVQLLRKGRQDGRIWTHACLFQYEWSKVTEQAANQGTIVLDVSKPFPRGWAQLPSFPKSQKYVTKKVSVLCMLTHVYSQDRH